VVGLKRMLWQKKTMISVILLVVSGTPGFPPRRDARYSSKAKLDRLRIELGGKRLFGSDQPQIHYWIQTKQATCVWCLYQERRSRIISNSDPSIYKRKKSRWGCSFCKVSLCKAQDMECWALYHSKTA
jgi:hypothetical protein